MSEKTKYTDALAKISEGFKELGFTPYSDYPGIPYPLRLNVAFVSEQMRAKREEEKKPHVTADDVHLRIVLDYQLGLGLVACVSFRSSQEPFWNLAQMVVDKDA